MKVSGFVLRTLFRHERDISTMSTTITDLQEVVRKQGEAIAIEQQESAEVKVILEDQAATIAELEEKLAGIEGAEEAVQAEIEKLKTNTQEIGAIISGEAPTDPNAPRPDNTLPGPQPHPDQSLPGAQPKPEQLPAKKA